MKQISRNKSDYTGFNRIIHSIIFSLNGLLYAYKNEKSLLLHGISSLLIFTCGLFFKISLTQWGIILITLGVILSFELVNTALEACVDMFTLEYNDLAKIAKDSCSAASFIVTIIGIIIAGMIFIPKIMLYL